MTSKKKRLLRTCVLTGILSGIMYCPCLSQERAVSDSQYKTIVAGSQYATSEKHQKKWGEHYRNEWNTSVKLKIAMLDTLAGGLTPYQEGGGRQSKTLRLRDAKGREYVLRSIDKTFGGALPDIAKGTFIEAIANDQVSIAHPYAAVTIPPMMQAAGIYHTKPQIFYIPKQPRLGEFNDAYGDIVYLFEQRPDENWEDASNFGYSKNIIGTDKLQEKLWKDNDNRVDQQAYIRARLFDFIIGDWGRHEDQWRWAEFENGDRKIYKPIPRDRDQAYTKFDGNMVTVMFTVAGFDHLQSFEDHIKDITVYNFPARNLDRLMANEMTLDHWVNVAKDLQQKLSDQVIEHAIRQMPAEVFPISGEEIIGKIKSRRNDLVKYATDYYKFLAINVDVPASNDREFFEINRTEGDITTVNIFKIKKDGTTSKQPFYSRKFLAGETQEIRLYGMEGDDKFVVKGSAGSGSLLRLVPGAGKDEVTDQSVVTGNKKKTIVYDDENIGINRGRETKVKISDDSAINNYQYTHFEYDKKGFVFRPGLTVGIGYRIQKQSWRKEPFGYEHKIMAYYGPNRGSIAAEYRFIANQLIGKWDFSTVLRADIPYVANYFGTGNESVMDKSINRKYYRYRATALTAGFGIHRLIDSTHYLEFKTGLQTMEIKTDPDRYIITKVPSEIPAESLKQKYFAGAGALYRFKKSDHPVVPTKGFEFNISADYIQNLEDKEKWVGDYASSVSFYIPFLKVLSLAVRAGGQAVTGEPEFYQLATLSGKDNLRGHRRQRYHGETSFYNNNELRLILNTRNRLFNGRYGVLAFVDQGRIWQPGEISDKWHVGYGGGVFVAPFNKILLNASYGLSSEDRVWHLRLGFLF